MTYYNCSGCNTTITKRVEVVSEFECVQYEDITQRFVGYENESGEVFSEHLTEGLCYKTLRNSSWVESNLQKFLRSLVSKRNRLNYVGFIVLHPNDVINTSKFNQSGGCCDDSYFDVHCSVCGDILGSGGLDCWQMPSVELLSIKVVQYESD